MSKLLDWRGHAWIALLVRLYLGVVFVMACTHKIVDPNAFAVDIATYQFLPLWAINAFAIVLPWLELFTGVMLVLGIRTQANGVLIAGMMLAFMVALAWALHLGLDMSCGCFASQGAVDEDPISWHTIVRDFVWLVQAVYITLFDRRPIGLELAFHRWRERHA